MTNNILQIDSVRLALGSNQILNGAFIYAETGKITGLFGRNGSGKTCLFKIIIGNMSAIDVSIHLNRQSMHNQIINGSIVKYLPQSSFLPVELTIKKIFSFYNTNFQEFINYFPEFSDLYNTSIKHLSSGFIRIIEIFIILFSKSMFCILDEPFSQIMPINIEKIKQLILSQKQYKGIIITDHQYDAVLDICDNKFILKDGITYLINRNTDLILHGYCKNKEYSQEIPFIL